MQGPNLLKRAHECEICNAAGIFELLLLRLQGLVGTVLDQAAGDGTKLHLLHPWLAAPKVVDREPVHKVLQAAVWVAGDMAILHAAVNVARYAMVAGIK